MTETTRLLLLARRCAVVTAVAACLAVVATPLEAGSRKPRLSRDLAEQVRARRDVPASVIVSGSDADVRRIAARYGAKIKKRLSQGAVLDVTGGQLVALSEDPDVAHISGDIPVRRTMAVAIGVHRRRSGVGRARRASRLHGPGHRCCGD